ncbi:hypothetical protein DP44_2987 [Burkholderia pseudomallei]|nr:hypothetical protein DP44_2987 [Burkholderia pseudomallei]
MGSLIEGGARADARSGEAPRRASHGKPRVNLRCFAGIVLDDSAVRLRIVAGKTVRPTLIEYRIDILEV